MAEQIEEQNPEGVVAGAGNGGGDGVKVKSNEQIAADKIAANNRLNLYNEILKLKEPGFSDVYKKAGYKKFDALLQTNKGFQAELFTDLSERGFNVNPDNFSSYVKTEPSLVADLSVKESATPPPLPKDEGILSQVKGMFKNIYQYAKNDAKELYNFTKRGFLTGLAGQGAQAENFATGTVDTKNLAKYLKKVNDIGVLQSEIEFAKDEGALKDANDFLNILIPSVLESFANMAGAGYKKLLGITAAGAGTGAAIGGLPGAVIGGGRALQGAMLQQGYNLEFVGTVLDELQTKKAINLDADEKTLEKQLNAAFANKELMAPIFTKANTRATAITTTDFLLSGMGATVAKNLAKSKAAGKLLNTKVGQMFSNIAEKTIANPVYRRGARLANRIAQIDNKIAGTKLGKIGGTVGIQDMFGGAAGETLAQALTQDELDWKSITVEAGAEGKFINMLRALGDIGEKRITQKAISQFATEKNLPPNEKTKPDESDEEFVAVTAEELNNYKKGNITPERAAGLRDDVDIAFKDPMHIEKVKAGDKLYGEMLQDAYNKHMSALENQKLRDVAISSVAELNGKKLEEMPSLIDPSSPAYNEKIAKDFQNTYSSLKDQHKKFTDYDSKDTAGVSSEVGGGTESKQTKSQQGASEEEAGDDRVLEEAAAQERLREIEDLLSDDDSFFNESNDRLLSPEERQDLEQERDSIINKGTPPSASTTQQTGVGNAPIQEGTQQTGGVPPQPASTEVVGNTGVAAAPQGETTQQPAGTATQVVGETIPEGKGVEVTNIPIEDVRRANGAIGTQGFTSSQMKDLISFLNTKLGLGISEDLFKGDKIKPLIDFIGSSPDLVEKIENYVKTDPIEISRMPDDTIIINDGNHRANLLNLIGSKFLPTVETVVKKAAAEKTTSTTTSTSEKQKPVAKEIKNADVEVRKGKTHDKDGVYEAVYKGKVIGKFSFDKKEKMWVDAAGDKFAQKKDAVAKMVLQYNMKAEAAAETTTAKGEKKTTTKKAQAKTQAEEEIPVVETEVVEEEVAPEGETKEGLGVIPTLVKGDFERNGDLTDKGFEKATRILKSIIDRVAVKAGVPTKRIYEIFHMTSDGKKYISATKGIMEIQVSDFKDIIKSVKRIAFDMFPNQEEELNQQINKHTDELLDALAEDKPFEVNPSIEKIRKVISDVNSLWAGTVAKAESLLEKGKTENKSETKPTKEGESAKTLKTETKPTGAAMPSSIQEAYSRRATLRMTAEALQKQMGGKKLSPKAQKELDTVNSEIAKLDNLLNTFEKEREKQRAAKAKSEQTSEKKETKTEEKPTTLVGGTLKQIDYGNYLIDKLVALDPQGRKATQGYIDAWNAITKTQENANKANSFLEDILVGMMPADKKPTAYADIREGFKKWQAGETTTETKGETKPTPTAAPAKVPSFSEFDAISADRSKMKEAKAEFIAKHGQLAYDAMKEISANFTKITKALQEKEILTKKC